jgi:uncharacterized protein (TIGR00299 family) protein
MAKVLYFDCASGISADMALGALIDVGADAEKIAAEVAKVVGISFTLNADKVERKGVSGVDVRVAVAEHEHAHGEHSHGHEHMTYAKVRDMIISAELSEGASKYALEIFAVLGKAEAAVHGTSLEEVAFHEVGSAGSLIDIIGTAVAADLLGVRKIYCGTLCDGSGTIKCAHGIIPVPVPAVREMAKSSAIKIEIDESVSTEMVTPSGYAILNGLGAEYRPGGVKSLKQLRVGYGFGKRDTGKLGAVRVVLGEE